MMSVQKRLPRAFMALVAAAFLLSPGAALATKAKVNVNSATQQELEALPGVGEATARKIIAGRPYSSVDDLARAGVPASTIDKIRAQVTAKPSSVKATKDKPDKPAAKTEKAKTTKATAAEKPARAEKEEAPAKADKEKAAAASVDLNTATQKELEALPGVGEVTAKKIIAGRPYSSVDDLAKAGVSQGTIAKIKPHVRASQASMPGGMRTASRPTPSQESKPAASAAPAPPAGRAPEAKPASRTADAPSPPAKGMVWVNTSTKVYHYEGDHWYGNTKEGKYMTEDEAIKAGYRASKQKQKSG